MSAALAGARVLTRIALRRDRVVLPASVAAIAGMVIVTAASFASLYPTVRERVAFAGDVNANAGLRALYGPVFDPTTIGGLTAWRMGVFGAIGAALLSLLLVVRHTRAEEESGRLELIGAGAVARPAPLAAALATVAAADLALALLTALGLLLVGEPLAGSLALGLAFALTGWVFAAVAAVAAQVTASARLANGIACAVLGAAFLLRAAGDAAGDDGPGWLTWCSPLGWAEQVRPYAGDRWAVLLAPLAATALLTAAAFALGGRRDLGGALVGERPGPPRASARLGSAMALAIRLQRGALIGWGTGLALAGAAFCGLADSVASLFDDNADLTELFQRLGGVSGVVDAYLSSMAGLIAIVAAAYATQAVLRLRHEEAAGRAEPLLAAPVTRLRWALGHLLFAFAGSALLLLAAGLCGGVAYGLAAGDLGGQLGRVTAAMAAQAPAAWVVAGLAVALVGLLPRRATLSWAALVAFVLLGQIGPLLELPRWALDCSPFTHAPKLPGGDADPVALLGLTAVAAALTAAGLAGLRRRDVG